MALPEFRQCKKFSKTIFGKDPHKGVNPDEVVAVGAAIQAGVLAGEVKDVLLLDVTPLTLGIETLGGVMTALIERNTTIPAKKTEVFSTASDNQPAVDIHVLQGERKMSTDNRTLGRFQLDGIPPAPRGTPQVEVSFELDANGILTVAATDKATGKEQNITIQDSSGLSESEIDKMVKEAEERVGEDEEKKKLIDTQNQADQMVYQLRKMLDDNKDKIDDADKEKVEAALTELEKVKDSQNVEEIEAAIKTVEEASHKIAEKMYEKAQAEGGGTPPPGADMGGMGGGGNAPENNEARGDDNVVDADFEVVDEEKKDEETKE